ncbi:fibronectin type III domain-containing protein [Streptomyces sp. NBC_00576]|uniref:fibronectin type III domain-containing protein n=1 Tax=Streptomyces sp. NBC_00576 TaxID=2903665 RepID=UPI002E804E33|nr:PA14 domain-containing protein [Streptomyces sp. NBC_00576]WUB73163.1 PA14 domain-containing protein [Streptomyces sp. NBC_00576]
MNIARRTTTSAATAVVLATAGGLLTAVAATPASAAANCNSPAYKRQFFGNTAFSGTPKRTDCDASIAENWGAKAPARGLPKDGFGVRWTVTRDFGSGGPFALTAVAQDGIRVYVDGRRKVDLWKNVTSTRTKKVNVTIPSGRHTLRVDYANWTGNANVNFAYAPRTSATVDRVAPLTPAGAAVAYDKSTGRAKLTWAKNKELDLAGYRIYRRLNGSSFGGTPLARTTSTSYTDTTLPVTGASYYYEVRAYDRAGNESGGTADKGVVTVDRTAPAAPQGPTVINESELNGLRVNWSSVEGATSYRVYRAIGAQGRFFEVGRPNKASYLDTSVAEDLVYRYRVSAVDAAGNESARSVTVDGTHDDHTAPPAVTGLKATPTEYGFKLNWDASRASDFARYGVYAGELVDAKDSTGAPTGEKVCSAGLLKYVNAGTTSYSYTTRPNGEQACFFVDALDRAWNSVYTETGSAPTVVATELNTTPSVATPPGSPLHVTAVPAEGNRANQIFWSGLDANSPQAASGYRVYRWNAAASAYERIAALGKTATVYVDTASKPGTTSYYWVKAVAADGTESLPAGDWAVNAPTT